MNLFSGIHEVRLFRPTDIAVGYFDSYEAALRAIENEPSQYRTCYFTLNPLKLPESFAAKLNPATLLATRNSAGDEDIARRIALLVDFDPPRLAGTNATNAEKQAAREQAERALEYLASRGWPAPMFCDSCNGWHLVYKIDLPNDEASKALLHDVLARLKQLFPMVDAGNFNASRICKLYGSWARKGEHTDERPWRRSAIVEAGSEDAVSEAQLRALLPANVAPVVTKVDDVKLTSLLGFLDYYGVAVRSKPREIRGGWQVEIECPWLDEHSSEAPRDTVASFVAGIGYGFKCFHGHCVDRHWREFRTELEKRNPGLSPYFGKLPAMTHSDIARAFVESHDDFVRLYESGNRTGAWLEGKRWALDDPGDALLRMAIRRYLDELHTRYPEPEQGQRDTRRALKQAAFVSGVLSEVKPFLPPKPDSDFDTDAGILPLDNGAVADLRTGFIRSMCREDCQTKRLKVTPLDIPTPRWDRFLLEIAVGRAELAAYLARLAAIAITGIAPHILPIFYGRGRNGKGVYLRLLEKLLGRQMFAVTLRPDDVESNRGGDDRNKRLMGRLKGMRLAFTSETASGHLDWTLLKSLTGGDSMAGARLYENEESFPPSHLLILTTNDRPVMTPSIAIRERLRLVPFDGDFSRSKDYGLENDLAQEIPGILWKLIQITPSVFTDGDEPPACVLDATADLLDENDVARPFIEECLMDDPNTVTPIPEIKDAIHKWRGPGIVLGDDEIDRILQGVRARWSHGRKRVQGVEHPVRGLIGVKVRSS